MKFYKSVPSTGLLFIQINGANSKREEVVFFVRTGTLHDYYTIHTTNNSDRYKK